MYEKEAPSLIIGKSIITNNKGASFMTKLSHLPVAIQNLLKLSARQSGFDSGFVQRRSKLSAESFVQTLTFGWLANPSASLLQLAHTAALLGIDISAQALDQRFNKQAASCLLQVLQSAVELVIASDPVAIPVLRRFKSVELVDTTIVCLPVELSQVWSGCGGTLGNSSSLKIELGLDLLTGRLEGPHLHAGRTPDCKGVLNQAAQQPNSLRLCDMAYFKLQSLKELSRQGVYWITRLTASTGIVDQRGKRWRILDFLRAQKSDKIEAAIKIGFNQQVECRLVAVKVSKQTAERRRRQVRDKARRNCNKPDKHTLALAEWTVLVTNVESEKLSLSEVLVMARVRWQIELLFKLWKSQGRIDESRSKKPWRVVCEVYAKLLAMLIQHWVLVVSGWSYAERSLFKAGKVVQMMALQMATAIESVRELRKVIKVIEKCVAGKCRVDKRKRAPSSFQLLLNDALA